MRTQASRTLEQYRGMRHASDGVGSVRNVSTWLHALTAMAFLVRTRSE
jgi:hypothetical protein